MNLTPAVEAYFSTLQVTHGSGGATDERSYYPALNNLLNAVGGSLRPKVFSVSELAQQGAGHPDFGLYAAKQIQKGKPLEAHPPRYPPVPPCAIVCRKTDRRATMPTKRLNERYLGAEMRVPLSEDGQVAAYVWPIRIVRIAGVPCGGPTVGVEVRNQEVARFDCHESRGHWHSGRYNPENPTASQQPFPEDLKLIPDQLAWAFNKIRSDADALVRAAEFTDEAEGIRADMIATAVNTIQTHLTNQGDLRAKAIADKLIEA